jgi:toxin ParE1/3/4
MKLVLSDEAKRDLVEIGDYIARDNRKRALAFVKELRAAMTALLRRPKAFALVPRYAHLGIRHRVHSSYLIFYRCDDHRVSIVRVLQSARDYEELLGDLIPKS